MFAGVRCNHPSMQELIDLVRHAHGMRLFLGEATRKEDMKTFVDCGLDPSPKVTAGPDHARKLVLNRLRSKPSP